MENLNQKSIQDEDVDADADNSQGWEKSVWEVLFCREIISRVDVVGFTEI